jgi:hypothetical protein
MISMTAPIETSTPAALAATIHDDVLQSLGVAVLGVDLCRRLHERMRYDQALEELTGIVEALGLALASSERLTPDLHRVLPPSTHTASARPSLMVMVGQPSLSIQRQTAAARPVTGPDEIVETLAACQVQARRCRHQYDAGLGEETMRDLELLLQRLEFVSLAFRDVMGQLRQSTAQSFAPRPTMPRPQEMVTAWVRSA